MTEKSNAKPVAAKADETKVAKVPAFDDTAVFQQGRTAALGSISQEDAPYDKSNPAHRVWLKGWKSVQG